MINRQPAPQYPFRSRHRIRRRSPRGGEPARGWPPANSCRLRNRTCRQSAAEGGNLPPQQIVFRGQLLDAPGNGTHLIKGGVHLEAQVSHRSPLAWVRKRGIFTCILNCKPDVQPGALVGRDHAASGKPIVQLLGKFVGNDRSHDLTLSPNDFDGKIEFRFGSNSNFEPERDCVVSTSRSVPARNQAIPWFRALRLVCDTAALRQKENCRRVGLLPLPLLFESRNCSQLASKLFNAKSAEVHAEERRAPGCFAAFARTFAPSAVNLVALRFGCGFASRCLPRNFSLARLHL